MERIIEKMKIKVGIIGCGKIAGNSLLENELTHAGVITNSKNFILKGCFDKNDAKSKALVKKFNCIVVSKYADFINQLQCDIIVVSTNDETHFKVAKKLMTLKQTPKIILLEKPMATTKEDTLLLRRLSKQRNVKLLINMSKRREEYTEQLKRSIKKRVFGKLVSVNIKYYGGLVHNGVHALDLIQYIFDQDLKCKKIFQKKSMQKDINVFCELYLFNNRVPVIMNYIDEKYYQIFELDIQFSKYRVRINNFGNEVLIYKRVINKIGENVLKFDHQFSIDNNTKAQCKKFRVN